ncbi:alpha/beta fold hydrolase [Methylobacterium nonmethylotrophicum]|uniref:Alpha/beta fold hydrolase n=1 Tax=Methylobacterium nonmethylotrophicum TaxID=1141884 RepID=A0A4Z0NYC5_9HYPH|nr:alpha/beta fold hydrolase [Methylobacterium nonmethylotrophicum]TGE02461.1 alpha/beta fold hydrolase [Methylobacterium nonmethylotrophicum]
MKFLLVHGSWHDGDAFSAVADKLRAQSHDVYTPTIAGHGKGADKAVNHADCTASIVRYIRDNDLDDFVLLGHSYGGTIISKVVEQVADRVRRLVFWNAFVLNDGESLLDAVPPHYREMFTSLAKSSPDNTVSMPFPVWREAFVNDADLETARATYALLSPEPFQPFADKLDLKGFYEIVKGGRVPCSYINATEDAALPQGPDFGWHPRMSNRLGLFRLVQVSGSHELLFTAPDVLAEAIIRAGRD